MQPLAPHKRSSSLSLSFRVLLVLTVAVSSVGLLPATASAASGARAAAVAEPQVALATGASQAAPDSTLLAVAPPLMVMTATPEVLSPGDVAGFTVSIVNVADAPLTELTLDLPLASGLVYVEGSAQGLAYNPADQTLAWRIPVLQPGERLTGGFGARAQGLAIGEQVQLELTAIAAELPGPVSSFTSLWVDLPAAPRAWITPAGGVVGSHAHGVHLQFPPGAVAQPVEVTIGDAPSGIVAPEVYATFALTATDEAGQPVTRFARPVTVTFSLEGDDAALAARSGSPSLFWLDEANSHWTPVASQVDLSRGVVTAAINHFSTFGEGSEDALSYGVQHLPTVHGFATDEWSGNSGVSYQLALPPGPGGLGVNLSLNYSSEGVNSVRQGTSYYSGVNYDQQNGSHFNRQAGFVGWGWSMSGLGQVTTQMSGAGQGRAWLGYAGGGFELKRVGETPIWQTEPQSFLRIEHSGDAFSTNAWTVWTPDGTKHTFGGPGDNGLAWNSKRDGNNNCYRQAREQHLIEVLDTHGNKAVVSYAAETKDLPTAYCANDFAPYNQYVRAIRPTRVEYIAKNQTLASMRVDFVYSSRSDKAVPGQNDPYNQSYWSAYRLTGIEAKVRKSTSADDFEMARSYALSHDYVDEGGNTSCTDQKCLLRLTSVTEKGRSGGALPAWQFTYTNPKGTWINHWLLYSAGNGQGGSATYTYGEVTNVWMTPCGNNTSRYRVSQMSVGDGLGTAAYNVTKSVYSYSGASAWAEGDGSCPDKFEFLGHASVTRQTQNGVGALAQVTETSYHQWCAAVSAVAGCPALPNVDPRKGKASLSIIRSQLSSGELARTASTWSVGQVNGTNWVYKADETQTLGASNQKTVYEYQTGKQGGMQYGNLTHARTYLDSGATLLRSAETEYFPTTNSSGSPYIVNRPARQRLLDAGGVCQGETRIWYDGNTAYSQPPTVGDVKKTQVAQTSCGSTWSESSFGYDAWGNQTTSTDPNSRTTTTTYDTAAGSWPMLFALPTSTTLPAVAGVSLTTSATWDKVLAQVTAVTDPNNATTSYEYDQWGRQTREIRPGDSSANPTVRLTYSNYAGATSPYWVKQEQRDNASSAGTATYLETRTFYDGLGRAVQTQAESASSSKSSVANTRYGPLGSPAIQITPYLYGAGLGGYRTPDWTLHRSETTYDALGRATQTAVKSGSTQISLVRSYFQDRKTAVIDPLNHQTISETDALGRLLSVKQYSGTFAGGPNWGATVYGQSQYGYDLGDRLVDAWDPANNNVHISYDLAGRKVGMTDPDMGVWSYSYDGAGNLKYQTDARGQTICFYYDALNRLLGKHGRSDTSCPAWNGGALSPLLARYYYDESGFGSSAGRRTRAVAYEGGAANNTISFTYDARGRVTSDVRTIDSVSYTTSYAYDALDRATWMQYPDGEGVTTAYSSQGQVKSVGSYLSDAVFNARGQATCYRYGSPAIRQTLLFYNDSSDLRLSGISSGAPGATACQTPSGTALQNLAYSYDLAGNIASIVDGNSGPQTQAFTYDALDRLTRGYTSGGTAGTYDESVTYNATGNLTSKSGVGSYTYGVQAADCPEGALNKAHAVVAAGSNYLSYCYDQNGNMRRRKVGATATAFAYDAENRLTGVSGAATAGFVYDADGGRVKATFGSNTTIYVGAHYEKVNGTVVKYYYAGDRRIAMRTGGQTYYLLLDHLGGTHITANSSGVLTGRLLYRPWGETRETYLTTPTTWRFTGQREDASIGLYYFNARYYDPVLGRFTQPDSIVPDPGDPQALNRYSYANNNPVKFIDRDGHFAFIPILIGVAIVGLISYDYLAHPDIAYAPALNVDVGSLAPSDLPDNDAALCGSCPYIERGQWATAAVMGVVELTPLDELPGANKLIREATEAVVEPTFRRFTKWNFRENLQTLTGRTADEIVGVEAHHVLPQEFRRQFQAVGLDIHDPRFGSWVEVGSHRQWSYEYNEIWRTFLIGNPSAEEILRFAQRLAQEFHFDVYIDAP